MVLSSCISGSNHMLYFFFLLLSGCIFVNRSLELNQLLNKVLGHYIMIIILMIVGINCFLELIVLFFAISLNLTTREIYFNNNFPYLKSSKNLNQYQRYNYMSESDLQTIHPRNHGDYETYQKMNFIIYNPFYRSFLLNWIDNFKRNCKKPHFSKLKEVGFDKNGFSLDSYSYVDFNDSIQNKSAIKMDFNNDSFFNSEKENVTSFSDNEGHKSEQFDNIQRETWSEADSERSKDQEDKENKAIAGSGDNSMLVALDELDSETQLRINKMIQSFKRIENSAMNLRKQYYSSLHQPIMSIFQIHCPQREKSLAMLYQKMIKTKKKLLKNHKQSVKYSAVEPQL